MTTGWFKSTASSDNSHCVKVKFDGAFALLGDTKHHHLGDSEPVLQVPAPHFAAFISALRDSH
jgi:hypothetical protein